VNLNYRSNTITSLLAVVIMAGIGGPIAKGAMPKEDLIDAPAIGEGLSLHNLFQSNMVVQRDKPVSIWGWADTGEKVTVPLKDNVQSATAAADRAWKMTFPAMPASSQPLKRTVKGKAKTLVLDNILVGDVWLLGGQSNMERLRVIVGWEFPR